VTDSPSVGTRISVISISLKSEKSDGLKRAGGDTGGPLQGPPETADRLSERLVEQRLELCEMLRHQAGRGRRRGRPAGIARPLVRRTDLIQHPLQIRLDEVPRPHVARLLLAPDDL